MSITSVQKERTFIGEFFIRLLSSLEEFTCIYLVLLQLSREFPHLLRLLNLKTTVFANDKTQKSDLPKAVLQKSVRVRTRTQTAYCRDLSTLCPGPPCMVGIAYTNEFVL